MMKMIDYKMPNTICMGKTDELTIKTELLTLKEKLIEVFLSLYETQCKSNKKLNLYNKIKGVYRKQPYLFKIKESSYRIAATKYRLSSHNLPVETGRYLQVARTERLCKLCIMQQVGDEIHYFCKCPYAPIAADRNVMLKEIYSTNRQLEILDEVSKFHYLMALTDVNMMRPVAKFLYSLLEKIKGS